jgi:hypothetical protein
MKWVTVDQNKLNFFVNNLNRLKVYDAAKLTIESIMDEYPPPYNLMVSGGIDSQVMLFLWSKFGKNFVPTSVVYEPDFNLHDILNLNNINYKYDFDIQYKKFDILSFYKSEVHEYAYRYKCSSPCINAHIKMSEDLQGTVIFSGDFLPNYKPVLSNAILGLYRASLENTNLIPYFFLHTPELAYSMQTHFAKESIYDNNDNDGYRYKILNYKKNNLPITEQKIKSTGFEKIKDYFDENFSHTVPKINRLRFAKKPSKRTFDLLLRYPYELIFDTKPLEIKINEFGNLLI